MPVIRLIYCSMPADQCQQAIKNWKDNCAPLMSRQPGCLSEQMLHRTDEPGEFISYSEWENEDAIRRYLDSDAHTKIKQHNRNIRDVDVKVRHYELVK